MWARFTAKTALADPTKFARRSGWQAQQIQRDLSQLRGEMFGEDSFVVADEDIRQLVRRGAIELSPQVKMQLRVPPPSWTSLAQDKRIVSILRTKISNNSLEGTGATTRGALKRQLTQSAELQDPNSKRSRDAARRNESHAREVQQRRRRHSGKKA